MSILDWLTKVYEMLKQPVVQWALWTIGSIIMIFTPDHIDKIIEGILALLGVKSLYEGMKNITDKK